LVFGLHRGGWYLGLAVMLALIMISTKSTTKFLNHVIVSALINGREAQLQRTRFSTALDNMSHGLCMADRDGEIIVVNRRLREFFDLPAGLEQLDVRQLAGLIADRGQMAPGPRTHFVEQWAGRVSRRDSAVFTEAICERLYDFRCEPSESTGVVFIVEDVTEARIASRQIEHMAHFDALTGLPNRVHFHEQLVDRLAAAAGAGDRLALLSIDLDQFKEVNDTRGHPTGDELLKMVAKRLRSCVKQADLVSRFGGDEFQVLIRAGATGVRSAEAVAERIIQTLSHKFSIDGQIITIGASVGIAFTSETIRDADELLRCADLALYRAKADGKGVFRLFSPDLDAALQRKRAIEQDLRQAILGDALELHYQPIVDVRTGRIAACEALVRMRHPERGMVPPDEFISIAEETGLIVELGDWVLRRACADAMLWPKSINVAVNLSAKQFVLRANLIDDIKAALSAAGLDAERLEVEITESTIIEAKDALGQLQAISAAGVKISLDDFGTGYSSLSYLRQFPVDKIKIDRSFAWDTQSRASQAVIGSVSVLGHLLGVQVVMEGVETGEQLDAVRGWNVHLIQGYLFSAPKPLSALLPLLSQPRPFQTARRLSAKEQIDSLRVVFGDAGLTGAAGLVNLDQGSPESSRPRQVGRAK
jgi:diguanylate cyclase (GGDEF)-like protein